MRFGQMVLVVAAAATLSGCLTEDQFHGTTGEAVQSLGVIQSEPGYSVEARFQFLSDYDFWGSRRAGMRYDYFLTNQGARPLCFWATLDTSAYRVREVIHQNRVLVQPGATAHLAKVRFERDSEYYPMPYIATATPVSGVC